MPGSRSLWDQIGRLGRISNLTNIDGVPNARVVSCPRCGNPTSPSAPALVIHGIDGTELDDVNVTHLANPGCSCSMVDGIRTDSSPEPVRLRALDKGWERLRDTVSTVAPHVVVEDFDPPQSDLLKKLDTPTKKQPPVMATGPAATGPARTTTRRCGRAPAGGAHSLGGRAGQLAQRCRRPSGLCAHHFCVPASRDREDEPCDVD
jgi:hypothetical protein